MLLMQCHRQVKGKEKITGDVAGKGEVLIIAVEGWESLWHVYLEEGKAQDVSGDVGMRFSDSSG